MDVVLFRISIILFLSHSLSLSLTHTHTHTHTHSPISLSLSLTPSLSLSLSLSGTAVSGVTACVCGSLAALVAETVCTPLDVVRTRIMVLGRNENKLEDDKKSTENTINTRTNDEKSPLIMFNKIIKEEGIASLYKGANVRVRYYLCLGSCILFYFFYSIGRSLSFSFILSFTILFYLLFFQKKNSLTFLFLYYLHNFLTFPSFFYCQAGFPGRRGHS